MCKSDQRPSTLPVGPVVTVMGSLQTPTPNSTGESALFFLSFAFITQQQIHNKLPKLMDVSEFSQLQVHLYLKKTTYLPQKGILTMCK